MISRNFRVHRLNGSQNPKLIITIDTEPDNQWQRHADHCLSVHNVNYIPRFQELCDTFDVTPTYLVTSSVANSEECVRVLSKYQDKGRAEIGAHRHPWETPPFFRGENTSQFHAFPHEFTFHQLERKLSTLTQEITSAFGISPKSYRAGRYGICLNQVRILDNLGYLVDCSITPRVSWTEKRGFPDGNGGLNFVDAPIHPYWIGDQGLLIPDKGNILEMPVTILQGRISQFFSKYTNRLKSRFFRRIAMSRFLSPRWFRPFPWYTAQDLFWVVKEAMRQKLPYVQMIIHSSEFMPGGSPYWTSNRDIDRLFIMLRSVLQYTKELQLESATLREFANFYATGYELAEQGT